MTGGRGGGAIFYNKLYTLQLASTSLWVWGYTPLRKFEMYNCAFLPKYGRFGTLNGGGGDAGTPPPLDLPLPMHNILKDSSECRNCDGVL